MRARLFVRGARRGAGGAGRREEAGAYTRQAFWIAAALAIPYWAFCFYAEPFLTWFRIDPVIVPVAAGYLRVLAWGAPGICLIFLLRYFSEGTGHTRPTMIYGVLGALLNIPLNYVLMFGKLGFPALGTVGCGIASTMQPGRRQHRGIYRFDHGTRVSPPCGKDSIPLAWQ